MRLHNRIMLTLLFDIKTKSTVSDNKFMSPENNDILDNQSMSSASYCTPNPIQTPSTCLVQSVITMKTLNTISQIPFIDSGNDTYECDIISQDINQHFVETMSQSIKNALEFLIDTLYDSSKLLYSFKNWDSCDNLVKYFVDLIANMSEKSDFAFTCRDHVTRFVQNTAFKILDNHYLYKVSYC